MKVQRPTILIVEDDLNDQFLIRNAFGNIGVEIPIHIVNNGKEAIDYLNGEGKYADREEFPFPTTILTDLKMPTMDGLAVLEHIKSNPTWALVPKIVLSASADLDDVKRAYMLGAAAFHEKPADPLELRRLLKLLVDYWVTVEVPLSDESGEMLHTTSEGKLGERFAGR